MESPPKKDVQFYRFAAYGFLKNLRFFEPFLVLFFRDQGFSFLQIGFFFSVREVSTNLLEIPTGVVADLFGRRISMVLSMVGYLLSFGLFFFFPTLAWIFVAMVFFAVGEAFRTGTHKAMILEYLRLKGWGKWKASYYGSTRAASQLGSAANALIAAGLVFFSGSYRIVFVASMVPYFLNLLNLASYPKVLDGERSPGSSRATLGQFFQVFTNPRALQGLLNGATFDAFFEVAGNFLQPILKSLALALPVFLFLEGQQREAIVIGVAFFGIYLATSLASARAGHFQQKVGSAEKALNATFLLGVALLTFSGVFVLWGFSIGSVAAFFGLYLLHNLRRPLTVSFVSDQIHHRTMASGLSVESSLKTLLMAICAPIAGWVADRFGIGWALLSGGIVLGGLFFALRFSPPSFPKIPGKEG